MTDNARRKRVAAAIGDAYVPFFTDRAKSVSELSMALADAAIAAYEQPATRPMVSEIAESIHAAVCCDRGADVCVSKVAASWGGAAHATLRTIAEGAIERLDQPRWTLSGHQKESLVADVLGIKLTELDELRRDV